MYLTSLRIVFPASIFTAQYTGHCHWTAFRTLGHPGLTQEEEDWGEGEWTGGRKPYSVAARGGEGIGCKRSKFKPKRQTLKCDALKSKFPKASEKHVWGRAWRAYSLVDPAPHPASQSWSQPLLPFTCLHDQWPLEQLYVPMHRARRPRSRGKTPILYDATFRVYGEGFCQMSWLQLVSFTREWES